MIFDHKKGKLIEGPWLPRNDAGDRPT